MSNPVDESRLRRFTHPEANVVWAAIEALPVAQQHEVLRELASAVAIDEASPRTPANKVRKGVAALRQAFDLLGHSPSIADYRKLRDLLPELDLPPEANIRKWLDGGWDRCLTRALLPVLSDGDFSEMPKGGRFEEHELHEAVLACAEELGRRPFWSEYKSWAKRCEEEGRLGRRPLSSRSFERFGGYLPVLVAAGVLTRDQAARDALDRVIPATHEYNEADHAAAILRVKAHLKLGRAPRTTEYTRVREEFQQAAAANGELASFPTLATITKKQTWDEALERAGLEPLGGRTTASNRRRRRPSYTEEQCLAALREAWPEVGEPFTAEAYELWRSRHIEEIKERGEVAHIPSAATASVRFKGWARACSQAIPGYVINPKHVRPYYGRRDARRETEQDG